MAKSYATYQKCIYINRELPGERAFWFGVSNSASSVSIPANIAEGAGRATPKELVHFLSFSLGSAYELETELFLAKEFNYIDEKQSNQIHEDVIEVQKLVYSLMKKYESTNDTIH